MKRLFHKLTQTNWKYIIGELSLIVLGILIALYINNWNEARKLKSFEKEITSEIKTALSSDVKYNIDNRIDRGNQIMLSATTVLKYLDEEIDYHDSLETHFWRMNWILVFEPQTIPFERLKSKGIEVLSNEEVRLKILELYDFTYPRISYFIEDLNTWSMNRVEPFCLKNFHIINLSRGKGYKPVDKDFIANSVEYRNLVMEKRSRTRSLLGRISFTKGKVEELLGMLED